MITPLQVTEGSSHIPRIISVSPLDLDLQPMQHMIENTHTHPYTHTPRFKYIRHYNTHVHTPMRYALHIIIQCSHTSTLASTVQLPQVFTNPIKNPIASREDGLSEECCAATRVSANRNAVWVSESANSHSTTTALRGRIVA